jgi:hypothetical protein
MNGPRPFLGLAIALLLAAAPSCSKGKSAPTSPPEVPEELARLVPGDAFCCLYWTSFDAASAVAGDSKNAKNRVELDSSFQETFGVDPQMIDRTKPGALVFASSKAGGGLGSVVILAAKDTGAAVKLWGNETWHATPSGSYVALSARPAVAPAAPADSITKNLSPGDLCLRFDAARLGGEGRRGIDRLVEFALTGGSNLAAEGGAPEAPSPVAPFAAKLAGIAKNIASLDAGAFQFGAASRARFVGKLSDAPPAGDPNKTQAARARGRALAAALPENHSVDIVLGTDVRAAMDWASPGLRALFVGNPEPQQIAYAALFLSDARCLPFFGGAGAFSMHGSPEGMESCFLFDSPDPKGFLEMWKSAVADTKYATNGAGVEGLTLDEKEGFPDLNYRLVFDPEKFHLEGLKNPEVAGLIKRMIGMIYGEKGIQVRACAIGSTVAHMVNIPKSAQLQVLESLRGHGQGLPKNLESGFEVAGSDPDVLVQVELRGLMRASAEMANGLQKKAIPTILRGDPLPFDFSYRVNGTAFEGAASLDVRDAIALVRALGR